MTMLLVLSAWLLAAAIVAAMSAARCGSGTPVRYSRTPARSGREGGRREGRRGPVDLRVVRPEAHRARWAPVDHRPPRGWDRGADLSDVSATVTRGPSLRRTSRITPVRDRPGSKRPRPVLSTPNGASEPTYAGGRTHDRHDHRRARSPDGRVQTGASRGASSTSTTSTGPRRTARAGR